MILVCPCFNIILTPLQCNSNLKYQGMNPSITALSRFCTLSVTSLFLFFHLYLTLFLWNYLVPSAFDCGSDCTYPLENTLAQIIVWNTKEQGVNLKFLKYCCLVAKLVQEWLSFLTHQIGRIKLNYFKDLSAYLHSSFHEFHSCLVLAHSANLNGSSLKKKVLNSSSSFQVFHFLFLFHKWVGNSKIRKENCLMVHNYEDFCSVHNGI